MILYRVGKIKPAQSHWRSKN